MDAPKEEVYKVVDAAIAVIQKSNLPYQVGPFETTVEGELDELVALAKEAHMAVVKAGGGTVITYIKLATGENLGSSDEKTRKYQN